MNEIDIRVYAAYRKHGKLPDYETDTTRRSTTYPRVPIFVVAPDVLDASTRLEAVEIIRQNCRKPLILTDRSRVLAVNPEGYSYARYVLVIDAETAQHILSKD